jgi:ribonuclease-3
VLSLAVSEALFRKHPEWSEGELSLARSGLVRTASLAAKARALGLDAALQLGRGEEKTGGRRKASILAAAYESVLGAVFVDAGYPAVQTLVAEHYALELAAAATVEMDFKTRLQERTQARSGGTPRYRVIRTEGPDHARRFVVVVEIAGTVLAKGAGSSKRAAEQQAASRALRSAFWDAHG